MTLAISLQCKVIIVPFPSTQGFFVAMSGLLWSRKGGMSSLSWEAFGEKYLHTFFKSLPSEGEIHSVYFAFVGTPALSSILFFLITCLLLLLEQGFFKTLSPAAPSGNGQYRVALSHRQWILAAERSHERSMKTAPRSEMLSNANVCSHWVRWAVIFQLPFAK